MDEEQQVQTGVNEGSETAQQTDIATQEQQGTETHEEQQTQQTPEQNAYYADQRRKQELEQYRSQAETYQNQLSDAARLAGYASVDEYAQAIEEAKQQAERQQYDDAGIDPDTFNKLLENNPDIKFAREMRAKQAEEAKFNGEANELFAEFPDLKPESVPQEVFQLRESKGISLLDAYLRTNYKNLQQQSDQSAIQKLQQNAQGSPGALGAGADNHSTSIKDMPAKDFKSLQERVLRGENVQF